MSASRRRIVASIQKQEGDAPSLELVRRILAERAPSGFEARSLHWSSYFRIHHRHAAKLRAGRFFIAGDAAHIHSPFGGQGMNTGLHDIWNLVWKLDFFLKGRGNEELLDSYSKERIPVIENVIETTDQLTKVMGTPNKIAQRCEIRLYRWFRGWRHSSMRSYSGFQNLELRIEAPIVEGPGKRYFDDSLRGGKGIESRFLLFVDAKEEDSAKEDASAARSFRESVELRESEEPGIKLVRPDGYIAYAAEKGESSAALKSIRALLERQTKSDRARTAHSA